MDGKSLDITAEKLARLKELFPEVFSEDKIDIQRLRTALGEELFVQGEHYELSWAGKTEARKEIQKQTTATLSPDRAASLHFEQAPHIFIEGENLEVLRTLQKAYFGKVKMIYIDPPYNTGNDSFVYPDDYTERQDEYKKRSGITDHNGFLNKQDLWRKNVKENGQFHSVWLSMMYPRLYLARTLLREDGVIFISINDSELSNLKLLCDEIFGGENFISTFVWQSKKGGGNDTSTVVSDHEYVICYCKNINNSSLGKIKIDSEELNLEDEKGEYRLGRELNKWGSNSRRIDRPTMWFPIYTPQGEEVYPIRNDGEEGRWRYGKTQMMKLVENGNIEFYKRENGTFIAYEKIRTNDPRLIPHRTWLTDIGSTSDGSKIIKELFEGAKLFDFPKPTQLVRALISIGTNEESDLILDFFAGSGTTAQAVLELNEEDGGNRRFILVQMPEKTEEGSEAHKAGYHTIADITQARIRKVMEKIASERQAKAAKTKTELFVSEEDTQPVLGFQSYKLAPSNFKQWNPTVAGETDILAQLDIFRQAEIAGSLPENMLYELLLKSGFDLTTPVEKLPNGAYNIAQGKVWLFMEPYRLDFRAEVLAAKPERLICLDSCFGGDDVAITNLQLRLREHEIDLTIL
ncbi:MAG: site-specific DNA-methyltransferase [Bacteroidota bacterium]